MVALKFYNTLTRKKEKFQPIHKKTVGLYSCGPTVYWYQHIGNLRAYVFSDILKRTLQYSGYKVTHVINVTDVGHLTSDADDGEDKMEKAAAKEGKKASDIAQYYFDVFRKDMGALHILEPSVWCKATDHIAEQIALVAKLEKNGFTYQTSDGIYFDSMKFKRYGALAKLNLDGLEAGKRVATGAKKHKTDFALWKFSEKKGERQQEWDSPWGVGFPGWHIECSAMSMNYLGEHFDIHTGGEDHIPIHHTNEIAQSECATGKKFVNYWMHGAFLVNKEGEKVSKSKGGLFTVSELAEKGYDPLAIRYLFLMTHYRKQLKFSLENLDAAQNALQRIRRKVSELRKDQGVNGKGKTEQYSEAFFGAISDDLNMPKALQVFWDALDDEGFDARKKVKLLETFDSVLGLGVNEMEEGEIDVPEEVTELLALREKARAKKDWKEADRLRDAIKEKGFEIEDSKEGARVIKGS